MKYAWLCGILTLLLLQASSLNAQNNPSRSDQLKAAFLFNYTRFIEWPNEQTLTQIDLCVLGAARLWPTLQQLVQGKTVRNRKLVGRMLQHPAQAKDCHLLFINSTLHAQLTHLMAALRGSHVLTIADIKGFAKRGGIIEFYVDNNKLRFAININAARAAGLRINPQLLDMAKIIDDQEGQTEQEAQGAQ